MIGKLTVGYERSKEILSIQSGTVPLALVEAFLASNDGRSGTLGKAGHYDGFVSALIELRVGKNGPVLQLGTVGASIIRVWLGSATAS